MSSYRIFGVIKGYCPTCKANQFFANTVGYTGTCPVCKTIVSNIHTGEKPKVK